MLTARGWSQNKQSRTVGSALARVLRWLARGARQDVGQVCLQPLRWNLKGRKQSRDCSLHLCSNFLTGSGVRQSFPDFLSEIWLISGTKIHCILILKIYEYCVYLNTNLHFKQVASLQRTIIWVLIEYLQFKKNIWPNNLQFKSKMCAKSTFNQQSFQGSFFHHGCPFWHQRRQPNCYLQCVRQSCSSPFALWSCFLLLMQGFLQTRPA